MARAKLKTRPSTRSVAAFIGSIKDARRRAECKTLLKMMKSITGKAPKMWGSSIVGFGSYHYNYASGREGDWFLTGFSPRKDALTVYIIAGLGNYRPLLRKLGKHKTGTSCLYLRSLDDADRNVLKKLIRVSVRDMKKRG